jgi:hypothetical protein
MSGPREPDGLPRPPACPPPWSQLRRLVDDVVRAARTLGTDLDGLLVWTMLACESLAPSTGGLPPAASGAARTVRPTSARGRPVRVRDLSRLTGIPRETVRRKLLALEAAGRAERVVDGWVVGAGHDAAALGTLADDALGRLRDAWRAPEAKPWTVRGHGSSPGASGP